MERLTRRDETGDAIISALSDMTADLYTGLGDNEQFLTDALNKLAAYEDAEEQGRLVVLPPVKIGDTLFYILNKKIYEGKLYRIAYENHQGKIHTDISVDRGYNAYGAHFEDFGKIVFATREEAEKALEGMG